MILQMLILTLGSSLISHQIAASPSPRLGLQTLTLEELVPLQRDFYPERLSIQWISDNEYVFRNPTLGITKYNALTDTFSTFLEEQDLILFNGLSVTSYSKSGRFLLLAGNERKVYRYSFLAEYSVFDIEKRTILRIGKGPLQAISWGSKQDLVYVQDNNVYYMPDVERPEKAYALTRNGVPNKMYYGVTDWIYEEEVFNSAEAFWISPASSYVAVASFNDTNVETISYPYYGSSDIANQYPRLVKFKYPKAGRRNPVVGLQIFNLKDLTKLPCIVPVPIEVIGLEAILGRVKWATDHDVVVLWLNRRQNVSVLINCHLPSEKCDVLKEHYEPNGWIDITKAFYDKTGTKTVELLPLPSGVHRYPHVGKYDFASLVIEDLTPGNSTVTEIVGWNQASDKVYYIVSPEKEPWQRQLWAAYGGDNHCVSCKEPSCHHVSAEFSPDASYAILTCSAINVPPKTVFFRSQDESLNVLQHNARLSAKLHQYWLPVVLFTTMSIGEGLTAHVKLLLPPERTGTKYPMIVRVYAGPGSTRVKDYYDLEYYSMYLAANRSIIVASIDVRGSGAMGVDAMFAVNGALGTVEITDTLAAIRQLSSLYPFIDQDRIGVFGWSYGGFTTTMMLIQDDKHTIACGAAVAPVTSWLYYDSIYTERFMDTPQANPLGYLQSDLMSQAERLRGRRYLLVHGTGDDNVHYQHSMQLAKKLQHADIEFEQMSYPDESHSLLGVSRHFYHTLDKFWSECFYR